MVLKSYPYALNIFLTRQCNLECQYCFVNKDSQNKRELDTLSLKKAIDLFLEFPGNCKTISFNGGEPLLRFGKVRKICRYMQHKNNGKVKLIIAVMSNGTLLTRARYNFLEKNKIILKVSIDGKRTIHDLNRPFQQKRLGSSYDRIMSNLKNTHHAKDSEYKLNAQLVFRSSRVENLLENIESLWRAGFGYIDFYPDLYASWSNESLWKLEAEFKKFTNFYLSIFENNKSKDIFENSLLHTFIKETELFKPIHCGKIHLDWNGNFYCCDKVFSLPEAERERFLIGNVKSGINNRLRLNLLEERRKKIQKLTGKDCSICKYLKYCFCPVGHYIYFSSQGLDFKEYFPQFCRISQIYIRNFLEIKSNLKGHPSFIKIYGK